MGGGVPETAGAERCTEMMRETQNGFEEEEAQILPRRNKGPIEFDADGEWHLSAG